MTINAYSLGSRQAPEVLEAINELRAQLQEAQPLSLVSYGDIVLYPLVN